MSMDKLPAAVLFPENLSDAQRHRRRFVLVYETHFAALDGYCVGEICANCRREIFDLQLGSTFASRADAQSYLALTSFQPFS